MILNAQPNKYNLLPFGPFMEELGGLISTLVTQLIRSTEASFSTMKVVMTVVVLVLVLLVASMPIFSQAMDIHQMRQIAAKNNVTCILVFGDSSVDPGHNNRISVSPKGNFPP